MKPDYSALKARALLLHAEGLSMSKIACSLGVHVNTIYRWVNSPAQHPTTPCQCPIDKVIMRALALYVLNNLKGD